jgi:hypothetical protein
MALRRRGLKWCADYYADGHRAIECTGMANRREAEKFLALRISEVERRVYARPIKISFPEFGKRYMDHAKSHKRSWLRDEQMLRRLESFFGDVQLMSYGDSRVLAEITT